MPEHTTPSGKNKREDYPNLFKTPMNEEKLKEEFNKFIEKWCRYSDGLPASSHLLDNDENDGEKFRELIKKLFNEYKLEIEKEINKYNEITKERLKYCEEENGRDYCKNCGLSEEDIIKI